MTAAGCNRVGVVRLMALCDCMNLGFDCGTNSVVRAVAMIVGGTAQAIAVFRDC